MRGDFSIIKIKKSQGGVCFLFFVLFFFFWPPNTQCSLIIYEEWIECFFYKIKNLFFIKLLW
jgi:hypothetical protein